MDAVNWTDQAAPTKKVKRPAPKPIGKGAA